MLAVGIDISKSKSTAAVLNADGTVLVSPFTFRHNQLEMNAFISRSTGKLATFHAQNNPQSSTGI